MTALYGKKIRMTQVFDESGALVPVTLLHVPANIVIGDRAHAEKKAKILAVFDGKDKQMNKPHKGQFAKEQLKGAAPRKKIFEISGFEDKKIGDEIGVEVFSDVLFVDVAGTTKGRGVQGVMKRHGAHGGPAKHGSKFHRGVGAVNQGGTPARFRKGAKMAGNMGNTKVTVQNLRVVNVDVENAVITVEGAVPGANGSVVMVRRAIKKTML